MFVLKRGLRPRILHLFLFNYMYNLFLVNIEATSRSLPGVCAVTRRLRSTDLKSLGFIGISVYIYIFLKSIYFW